MKRTPSLGGLLAAGAAAALAVPSPYARADEVKTLDDIRIEGEVRLPRVLFITSRETVRPLDFLGLCLPPSEGEELPTGPVPVIGSAAEAVPGAAASPATAPSAPSPAADSSIPAPTDTSREESR
jgi:hypothetical protein